MVVLGIETSCDETSAAVVRDGREILSCVVASQADIHAQYGGVVPEIASRKHIEMISGVVRQALNEAHTEIDAVAVTYAPGLIGALLVGVSFAKGYAFSTGLPLVPVHHLRGHIAANYTAFPELEPPFVCLVASGGHTLLADVRSHTDIQTLGSTRDDAAGEAFDKVARVLGLPYPGGAQIDALARNGNPLAYKLPRAEVSGSALDFSFSGLKTAVINTVHNASCRGEVIDREGLAASFCMSVADSLSSRAITAAQKYKKLVAAGGVAANSVLRRTLTDECRKSGISLYLPPPSLCGDNAAMIAAQGFYEMLAGNTADMSLNAYAVMPVELRL